MALRYPAQPRDAGFIDQANIPAGSRGLIAVYRSPSGGIDLTIATTAGSIPSCLNANDAGHVVTTNP